MAENFLLQKGFSILEKNWRYGHWEIDIIAKDKDITVFVEVKTRTGTHFGNPEDAVNTHKQEKLKSATEMYIQKQNIVGDIRFDVISIQLSPDVQILHIEDAFF